MPLPVSIQLQLTRTDRAHLSKTIQDDWSLDSRDMEKRNNARRRWYRLWRAVRESNEFPSEEASNFHIPLTQWQVLAKLAKELDALLGDDAEVIVRPIGPSDAEIAPKIQRYMNWRIKVSLKLFKKLYDYLLQKIVLGTSIAMLPWVTRYRTVRKPVTVPDIQMAPAIDPSTGLPMLQPMQVGSHIEWQESRVVEFDGPEMTIENMEDWAYPAHAKDINTADHFERRLRLTVDEILDMADRGQLDKDILTPANIKKLRILADTGSTSAEASSDSGKPVRDEKADQTGTPTEDSKEGRDGKLTLINWIGLYRRKSAKVEERAQEVVAYWQPDTLLLLGASRLVDQFPDGRRPFVKSELIRDVGGSFEGIGLCELLESINREMDVQHNAMTDAGPYALGPLIVYEPASGFNPTGFRYEPFQTLPVADANKVKALNTANVNFGPIALLQGQLLGFAERISGLTEAEMGRPFSQPNAPRTLGQQQILSAGSGVRLLLDLRLERESLREFLNRIWDLDRRFLPKPVFYRVSESSELEQMTEQDFEGNFDFDIGPLSGTANKAEEFQRMSIGYALALQNPIVAQNPLLLSEYLKKINTKLGLDDLNRYIPDMSALAPPLSPEQENIMLLEGRDVDPHPTDNHPVHIAKHTELRERLAQQEKALPGALAAIGQPGVLAFIDSHIAEHQQAMAGAMLNALIPPMMNGKRGIGNAAAPTDQTGAPGGPQNALKGLLNQGGLNLA